MLRRFLVISLLVIGLILTSTLILADDTPTPSSSPSSTSGPTPANQSDIEQLQAQISQYQQKIDELGKSQNTLANQIQILDSQVQLTLLNIKQTQSQITQLGQDINDLTGKISDLDTSLTQLSNLYLNQVTQNYKLEKRVPPLSAFLASVNFNFFLEQYKYLSVLQASSQNTLVSMETTRTTADQEKNTKEAKQSEMQNLQKKLSAQQNNLTAQKASKDQLLSETQNDENKYKSLLASAMEQLNELQNFSKNAGATCLPSPQGGGSNGWFFSQRDPRWCNQYIGLSKDTIGEVGCFISSISMIYKKYGQNMDPSLYASNPGNFFSNTAWMNNPAAPAGLTYKQYSGFNTSVIDNELKNDRPVIVQLSMKSISGMHFIVLFSGSNGNYKMYDPWFGADLDFNARYSPGMVMSVRIFTK